MIRDEELGCPEDVFYAAYGDDDYRVVYYEKGNIKGMKKVMQLLYNESRHYFEFELLNEGAILPIYVKLSDYKKTWWLKEDKSK